VFPSLCWFWAKRINARYNADFKGNIVKAELSKVFDNLQYEPLGRFDNASIRDLDFFKKYDAVDGNDLITANYKGIRFAQCDLKVSERHVLMTTTDDYDNTTKKTYREDIFKGRAMRFDFADKFRGRVQVVAKDFDAAKVKSSRGGWQTVETEFAEFGKHFDVFAVDPLDAMAVLTPQMIEGIFYLREALDVATAFYFTENTMVVFMDTNREAFDVSGKRTLLEERVLLQRDIALVTGFMDVMYFKAQGGTGDIRSETAAAVAAAIRPSYVEKIVRKAKRAAGKTTGRTLAFLPKAIIAVFLISAVYGFLYLPDHIVAGTSSNAPLVPKIGYMAVAGLFIVVFAHGHIIGALFLLLMHLLFMSANL
jgi:hypothetical protein